MKSEAAAGCGPAGGETLTALGVEFVPSRRIFPVPLLPLSFVMFLPRVAGMRDSDGNDGGVIVRTRTMPFAV